MDRKYRKFEVTADSLIGCRFFDEQDELQRARIARLCEGRTYRRGAEIIRHLGAEDEVFFILSGKVEATMHTVNGKLVSFQELHNGDMFGEVSAIDRRPRTTSVVASTETVLVVLSGLNFRELVTGNAELAERTMRRLCALARHLCEKAYAPRAYSVPDQVRLEIYRELRRADDAVKVSDEKVVLDPAPTHKDIAERVGTTREQVTRVISALSDSQLLRQEKRTWVTESYTALVEHLEARLQPLDC